MHRRGTRVSGPPDVVQDQALGLPAYVVDHILPDGPGVPPALARVDVHFDKSKACNPKRLEVDTSLFDSTTGEVSRTIPN